MSSLSSHHNRKYTIVPYDPAWKKTFEREEKILRGIFEQLALDIEHIGSTAVPGLSGKPTVDVLITVQDISDVDSLNEKMLGVGYHPLGDYIKQGAKLFIREKEAVRSVNVHVFQTDHSHVKEMLDMRDYFLAHPDDAKIYSDLKLELFSKFPNDYGQYRKYKDEFMADLKEKVIIFFE